MFRRSIAFAALIAVFASSSAGADDGYVSKTIVDPGLNMTAFHVMVPAGWHFDGTLVSGTQCFGSPFPVFRTFSPDGLSEVERLPRFDWYSSDNPLAPRDRPGCLNVTSDLTAAEFLKMLSAMLHVKYDGSQAVPQAQLDALNAGTAQNNSLSAEHARTPDMAIVQTRTMASALVSYRNGTFAMRGILSGNVTCFVTPLVDYRRMRFVNHDCQASIRYTHAPAAKFSAIVALTDNKHVGAAADGSWQVRYLQTKADEAMAASRAMFERDRAARAREHEDFLATMQRGTDASMRNAAAIANANHTIASDWTDYALDQQTVRDPGTGQISKVSSAYSHTWIDSTGKVSYQTSDSNANPNGSLPGVWTKQTRVHGDGS